MKVVFDDIIFNLQRIGGISLWWSEVICRYHQDSKHIIYKGAEKNLFFNDNFFQPTKKKSCFLLIIRRYINQKLRLKEKFIFHSSYYRYSRNSNAINITTVHDFTYEIYRHDIKSVIHKWQKKQAVMHSAGVVCVSNNTLKDFYHFYPKFKGNVTVIYHGFSSDYKLLNKSIRERCVVFVGARSVYKRFQAAVDIIEKIDNTKFLIVGGGPFTREELESLNTKIPQRFEWLGFLSNSQLAELYNRAMCLFYLSDYEGFGIPVLEAQACGCPVVCQRVSSLPEVVGDAGIYVDINNVDESVKRVNELFNDNYFDALSRKGLNNVKRFSWDTCASQTFSFYENLARNKTKKGSIN